MQLSFSLTFSDLYDIQGLKKLDKIFLKFLHEHDSNLLHDLLLLRDMAGLSSKYRSVSDKDYSKFLLDLAPLFDDFLAKLFLIEEEVLKSRLEHNDFDIIYECKRKFVQRIAAKKYTEDKISSININEITLILQKLFGTKITAGIFSLHICNWLSNPDKYQYELDIAAQYAAYMIRHSDVPLFDLPKSIDPNNLINQERIEQYKKYVRTGFGYFDPELTLQNAMSHAHYCIYCHNQAKDSCSKGFQKLEKEKQGCPLKQKISEMNYVKSKGFSLAALAIIIIDNPMVAVTGHRICNDCMNACIYQKQEPVNVPLIESNILQTILNFPYGVEIYLLLTRWNPLNIHAFLPKEKSGYNVLVTGLGPAGFSLAHYLLNEGHNVVAIDGLKITALPREAFFPIKCWQSYKKEIEPNIPKGFGGVAEYGITARWNKNNLTIIRLMLERRNNYKIYSGVRLGSNITKEQAIELGFDHIALCFGAGAPKILKLEKNLAKGIRTAADFLMTLQSGEAYHPDSPTNLMIRMPVVIIGCGLTAIDAAVEMLNYYPMQVEKFLKKYERLRLEFSDEFIKQNWTTEDKVIADEFMEHAKLFREASNRQELQNILNSIGGVTIYYRSNLQNSTAYKLNHYEIAYAKAAGVSFCWGKSPNKIHLDEYNYLQYIDFDDVAVQARTMLYAVGTGDYINNNILNLENNSKYSYFGDCNPQFAGSVVKAIASSKYGFALISEQMQQDLPKFNYDYNELIKNLDAELLSTISNINILSDCLIELMIYSPLAAKNFQPGQFFRLQNYSNNRAELFEPIAITGSYADVSQGVIFFVLSTVGYSSRVAANLKIGDIISLMGPAGNPTKIIKNINLVLIGEGVSNAGLISIAKEFKNSNSSITWIAGYENSNSCFYREKIENIVDIIIWCCKDKELPKNREQDRSIKGSVIEGLKSYNNEDKIDLVICTGSNNMMQEVKKLKASLFPDARLMCGLNSLMQCMMKGICGQCVQVVLDDRGYVFSCACQEQDSDIIDFENLNDRLKQNSLFEKLAAISDLGKYSKN